MKILKALLVAAALLQSPQAHAKPLPDGFRLLDSTDHEFAIYDKVRAKAIEMIRNAIRSPESSLSQEGMEHAQKVILELNSAKFAISINEHSEKYCESAPLFVQPIYRNVLFICGDTRKALRSNSFKNFVMAVQFFIHEAGHFVDHRNNGYANVKGDECGPTYFELIVMKNNVGKQNIPSMANRDGYKSQCGFSEYDDVPSEEERQLKTKSR